MLARLAAILAGVRGNHPSVTLVVWHPAESSLLHIVPETGDVETVHRSPPAFTHRGTTEKSHKQIALVPLEDTIAAVSEFLKEISTCAKKILTDREPLSGEDAVRPLEQALRSAVAETLESRAGVPSKIGSEQSAVIYLVHINRKRPGKISTTDDLTSFPA